MELAPQISVRMTWEDKRNKIFLFPEIVKCSSIDIRRIHPLKQAEAAAIAGALAGDRDVSAVYLYGSSVNIRCSIYSDTDVAILLKNDSLDIRGRVSEKIQELCDWNADVVWLNSESSDSRLYRDVMRGVRLV
ncbi:MAG: hypothetical protein IK001_07710 [Lachnospiraceae bacterium]|nr:hypothetical protein [Lachnospiraceae bacterium]